MKWALAVLAACQTPAAILPDAAVAPVGDAVPTQPIASRELCKLLSNRRASDPTPNDVQHRANVLGADLGIPVVADDRLYLLFGDTIGFTGIWGAGESHPDAVGVGRDPASAIALHPELLCGGLQILSLAPAQSRGPQLDPAVLADFAGAAMTAPSGHSLGEYIHDPAGGNGTTFPYLPGDFEVPSGAFAVGGSIYTFYTTVAGAGDVEMTGSYLAKSDHLPGYQILYRVDALANGALHGHFINIAAEVAGDYVYLFGTGAYRQSPIYLARKRLDALGTPGGFEELGPIIATPGYGETSVRYFPELGRWMLLAEESLPTSNRIVAYLADHPEGPWGSPHVVHDMGDPAFRAAYCCGTDDDCEGAQMFDCARTGFYGTYLFPTVDTGDGFTVTYTMSSFAPYNVALFQTTFR